MMRGTGRFYERNSRDAKSAKEDKPLSMNELDRELLTRCLERQPRGWEDFVDRFMGLVVHVIDHTMQIRGLPVDEEQRDRLCENVFAILDHDAFRLLREFDGQCSLTTYMTIITRRIVVRLLMNRKSGSATAGKVAA